MERIKEDEALGSPNQDGGVITVHDVSNSKTKPILKEPPSIHDKEIWYTTDNTWVNLHSSVLYILNKIL